jgi:hypothetical protein
MHNPFTESVGGDSDDVELVRQAKSGDRDSLERLVRRPLPIPTAATLLLRQRVRCLLPHFQISHHRTSYRSSAFLRGGIANLR